VHKENKTSGEIVLTFSISKVPRAETGVETVQDFAVSVLTCDEMESAGVALYTIEIYFWQHMTSNVALFNTSNYGQLSEVLSLLVLYQDPTKKALLILCDSVFLLILGFSNNNIFYPQLQEKLRLDLLLCTAVI